MNKFVIFTLVCPMIWSSSVSGEETKAGTLIDKYMSGWAAKPSWWWSVRFGQSTIIKGFIRPIEGDVGLMVKSGDREIKFEKLELKLSSMIWCEQEVFSNSRITNFIANGQNDKFSVYREMVKNGDKWRSPKEIKSDENYYVLQLDRIFGGDFIYVDEFQSKDFDLAMEAISEKNQTQPQWEALFISRSFEKDPE